MTQGLAAVGPKFGVSRRQVLAAPGVDVDLSPAGAAGRLADPNLGWICADPEAFRRVEVQGPG